MGEKLTELILTSSDRATVIEQIHDYLQAMGDRMRAGEVIGFLIYRFPLRNSLSASSSPNDLRNIPTPRRSHMLLWPWPWQRSGLTDTAGWDISASWRRHRVRDLHPRRAVHSEEPI